METETGVPGVPGDPGVESSDAPDSSGRPASIAGVRRRAWAQSRDSIGQGSRAEPGGPQGPQGPQQSNGDGRDAEETGPVSSKITSWLIECRTPLGASLDEQTTSPSKGLLRQGCSFEDDLSLGAEANHLQSSKAPESCFGLPAEQKRSRYKERGRSMNSTGSGKSSTVSSVSELLDLYEEDPEEILLNLGFGREEPDLNAKIPSRFFNNSSSARGIDIKVYLAAQLQRMELENPNYALTSRFRQIEVLTTVANEFFQLYSQVSGQPVQRISCKDKGGDGAADDDPPPLKRSNSALNVAKLLKKSISKHNLLCSPGDSPTGPSNGPAAGPVPTSPGAAPAAPVPDRFGSDPDQQLDSPGQKPVRKKDNFSLATVTEETSTDGDDRPADASPEQNGTEAQRPDSADLQPTNQIAGEAGPPEAAGPGEAAGPREAAREENLSSTPEKPPSTLAPPQLAQLRTENTNSFDMEEIQTNEDETLPSETSRSTDLSRTVSQQSDSSGFAEEPSVDSSSYLKVQESCDSCDSETTVTSHPSQDVATPLALDQPAFILPEGAGPAGLEGAGPEGPEGAGPAGPEGAGPEPECGRGLEQPPPPPGGQQVQPRVPGQTVSEPEDPPETPGGPDLVQDPVPDPVPEGLEDPGPRPASPGPASPVHGALSRARQRQLSRTGPQTPQTGPQTGPRTGDEPRRRGAVRLQRSASLPSSLLPPRVVSSVRIQFDRGQASCTPPRYSYKYTAEAGEGAGDRDQDLDQDQALEQVQDQEPEGRRGSCLSTLIIQPGPTNQPPAGPLPAGPAPPRPRTAPRPLTRAAQSLQGSSPPPDWGGPAPAWSTQSVPDLCSGQSRWGAGGPGRYLNPSPPAPQPSDPGSSPGLSSASGQFPAFPPTPQFPQFPYGGPGLLHHYSSLGSLHQPPPAPRHHLSPGGHLHPGTPTMHQQDYGHPHQSPYPYHHSYHGYGLSPYLPFPHAPPGPEHGLLHPPTPPGLFPGPGSSTLTPGPGPGPSQNPSSTEMQLRRVLHDIRGTVQSLNQNRVDAPDRFEDQGGAASSPQSLAEFQLKRRSLNMFRSQMMELELSIMRQQALVYRHLSPADRMEAEHLQSLRSAVREELQELEQQVEDRLVELTRLPRRRGLHRGSSVDSWCSSSALRNIDPMSELIREQLFLQSELGYDRSAAPSTDPSSRSSSPVRGGAAGQQKPGVYRASISITPAPPSRPDMHTGEEEERGGVCEGEGGGEEAPEEEGAAVRFKAENFQQLIREIRESVAQEVRREIYNELLAAASPRGSPLPSKHQPL